MPSPYRIPQQRRRQMRQQAARSAQRQTRSLRRSTQEEIGRAQRQTGRRIGNTQLAAQRQGNYLEGLSLKGLGQYRGQVAREIAASQRALTKGSAALTRGLTAERNQDVRKLRLSLQDKTKTAEGEAFNRLREAYQSRVQTRVETEEDRRENEAERRRNIRTAVQEARDMLQLAPSDEMPWSPKTVKNFGSEDDAWLAFEKALAGKEAVDPQAAREVVERLQRKRALLLLRKGLPGPSFLRPLPSKWR